MGDRYTVYGVDLSGTLISGVEDQTVSPGIQNLVLHGDGSANPTYTGAMFADPRLRFTTESIAAALTKVTFDGWVIDSTGVAIYAQKMDSVGRASGSVHEKFVIATGSVIPLELTATQDGYARLSCQVLPTWDGSNAPVVQSAASLAGSPIISEAFTLGQAKINNTLVGGMQSLSVNFGITVRPERCDGEGLARNFALITQDPVIRFTTTNAALLRTLGLYGTYGAANTTFWLTRCKSSDTLMRYANADAQHVSLTARGRIAVTEISGDPAVATAELTVAKESAVALITIATTATIA